MGLDQWADTVRKAEERDQLWEKVDTEGADYPPDYDQPFKWRKCYTLSDVMTSLATEKDEPGHAPHQERLVLTAEDLDGLVERFDRQEEKEEKWWRESDELRRRHTPDHPPRDRDLCVCGFMGCKSRDRLKRFVEWARERIAGGEQVYYEEG